MPRPRVPADVLDAMAEQYRAGATIRDLARRWHLSYYGAHRRLVRAGVTFRPATGAPGWRAAA